MAASPDRRWLALALISAVQFMVVLDIAIVNVALPTIQRDLGADRRPADAAQHDHGDDLVRLGGGARRLQRIRELGMPGLLLSGSKDEGPLMGSTKPMPLPAGRGQLVTRRGVDLVQVAWTEPEFEPAH